MKKKREKIQTSIDEIVQYWFSIVDESELSVDASEAHERCWRCGCQRNLQRCHIVPDALGGEDKPSNLVLLCARCHAENPNITDPEIMWDWLKAYKVSLYDTFWLIQGMAKYEFIYGKSFRQELSDMGFSSSGEVEKLCLQAGEEVKQHASNHFGQPYLNDATVAGLYRMVLKRIAAEAQREIQPVQRKKTPWWIEILQR